MEILDKFSNHLKSILLNSFNLAVQRKDEFIMPEHVLYCLSQEKGCIGKELLTNFDISTEDIKKDLFANKTSAKNITTSPKISQETKSLIEKTLVTANIFEHKFVGTEHLVSAFLQMEKSVLISLLLNKKINVKSFHNQVKNILKSSSKFTDIIDAYDNFSNKENKSPLSPMPPMEEGLPLIPPMPQQQMPAKDFLKAYTINLTAKSIQEKIDPVIGREQEIERLIQIVGRKNKNNPILLGDAGVGKTAIVEGLAKKIYQKNVPNILHGKKILSLDLGSLIAGTVYRGEFESRIKQVIDIVKKDDNIILFIDEIHNIMGAGSSTGTLDAANILKPALARGEIRCIGATTPEEFKQHIEKDPALERRFQPIFVYEPNIDNTKKILFGVKKNYEKFHNVTFSEEALNSAVELSEKFLHDKNQPDKSIDLIDEAASKIKIKNNIQKTNIRIENLKTKIANLIKEKEQAVIDEHFEKALKLKSQESKLFSLYEKEIIAFEKNQKTQKPLVTGNHILEIISKITNIPLEKLTQEQNQKILTLQKKLNKNIIGQNNVIEGICNQLTRSYADINNPNQPLASFLFLGPSGSGKTELAKQLAQQLFDSKDALIRIDMSEFSESFNISKLIGSPAGYVGYREGNKFTDLVKKRSHCLVLLDEIEKAHPKVINLLLQILDDGYVSDAIGRKINFKNTIIIMTSNIGLKELNNAAQVGFETESSANQDYEDLKNKILQETKRQFSPEFINRINKVLIFNYLSKKDIKQIFKLQIENLNNRLKQKNININSNTMLLEYLSEIALQQNSGGRAVKSIIEEYIENPLAVEILKNKKTISNFKIRLKKGKVQLEKNA